MFYVRYINLNILNINNNNHNRLCSLCDNVLKNMNKNKYNDDYYKLKNLLSIYLLERINYSLTNSEMEYLIFDYGFDNAIINYKKHYKIIDNINTKMLIYNLIYNNYFEIIDLNKKLSIDILSKYIKASNDRKLYKKKINIKRESIYLMNKINNEIKDDNAKLILNTIVTKFIDKTIKNI